MWNPSPYVMVLGDEALGRRLGHEGSEGVSVLVKEAPESPLASPGCETQLEGAPLGQQAAPHQAPICWCPDLGLLSLQNCRKCVCVVGKPPNRRDFSYSGLNGLRHPS